MNIWIDGAGWNGKVSRYCIVYENGDCEIMETTATKTNNVMEYKALGVALLGATNGDTILTDSKLLVGQVTLGWKVNAEHLKPFVDFAMACMLRMPGITLKWVPREENLAGLMLEGKKLPLNMPKKVRAIKIKKGG